MTMEARSEQERSQNGNLPRDLDDATLRLIAGMALAKELEEREHFATLLARGVTRALRPAAEPDEPA